MLSRTQGYLANVASVDIKKAGEVNSLPKKEAKHVNFEQLPIRRRTMGAEDLRLSRVDVRGRQQKFEKLAGNDEAVRGRQQKLETVANKDEKVGRKCV